MPRPPTTQPGSYRGLALAALALLPLSLLPARWGHWADGFGNLTQTLVTPVKHPVGSVARWLARGGRDADPKEIAELKGEVEKFRQLFLTEQSENQRLRALIETLQKSAVYPDLAVRLFVAPVVGGTSNPGGGLLQVLAGKKQGVEVNTVATVGGIHLLGRVERVSAGSAWVRLITSPPGKQAAPIDAAIMTGAVGPDGAEQRLNCPLYPSHAGTLKGQVEYRDERTPSGEQVRVLAKVGQTVRLADATWPKNAQMLLIGTVERVDVVKGSSQRQVVTVRPTVPLEQVSEVVLRLTPTIDPDEAAREGGRP